MSLSLKNAKEGGEEAANAKPKKAYAILKKCGLSRSLRNSLYAKWQENEAMILLLFGKQDPSGRNISQRDVAEKLKNAKRRERKGMFEGNRYSAFGGHIAQFFAQRSDPFRRYDPKRVLSQLPPEVASDILPEEVGSFVDTMYREYLPFTDDPDDPDAGLYDYRMPKNVFHDKDSKADLRPQEGEVLLMRGRGAIIRATVVEVRHRDDRRAVTGEVKLQASAIYLEDSGRIGRTLQDDFKKEAKEFARATGRVVRED